jgi:hypothetical protein
MRWAWKSSSPIAGNSPNSEFSILKVPAIYMSYTNVSVVTAHRHTIYERMHHTAHILLLAELFVQRGAYHLPSSIMRASHHEVAA